ncbi:MAG: AAA family ATPase [Gammaproteobacteria bacterium]
MYLEHFHLNELPFSITPDTTFFMNRSGYQDALNVLLITLRSGEGFIKVTGEVGVGKTLLCRMLLRSLGPEYVTAYIHNPYIKPDSLLFAIADELNVPYTERVSQYTLLKLLTNTLMKLHEEGKRVVVCLDEVQAMPVKTLEALRLLTNLETEKSKLIQVVLFGQPELDSLLNQPSIRQLKQRITFSYRLLPLNRIAVNKYIQHRLHIAGCQDDQLINRKAVDQIYKYSGGIPRLINIIGHKSLLSAYGEGSRRVTHKHVAQAVEDMDETYPENASLSRTFPLFFNKWLYGAVGLLLIVVGTLTYYGKPGLFP